MALLLRRKGITRVRPLAGGLEAWRELGFPLATLSKETVAPPPAQPAKQTIA